MKAPLLPVPHVSPVWVQTSTGGGGAFTGDKLQPERPADLPHSPAAPELPAYFGPAPEVIERLLPPPPPPESFTTQRSEDGRMALTNEGLELNGEQFAWRELEGVDVQPVRWLLGMLLGAFIFCGFLLAYLQFWLQTAPAALGIGLGIALLAWGLRGTNRWRLHRPAYQTRYFALSGSARSWQALAHEANRRIGQRHHETATATAYWFQQSALMAAATVPEPAANDPYSPV